MGRRGLLVLLVLAAACGGDDGVASDIPDECNPLGGAGCVTPWPSSAYLREDATSPTGVRLDLAPGAIPANADGLELDVTPFNRRTGYSPAVQIFTVFPEGVDDSNLVFHDHIADSLGDASPTVVLDLDTGERVPHFAELDVNAGRPDLQALYLRPMVRLTGGHHYAAAVRRSLKAAGGGELARPAGFQAILDGRATGHPRFDAVRAGTEQAVAGLEAAGIPRDDLVVAWDFVTADDDSLLADTRGAIDAAIAAAGDGAANVTYAIEYDGPVPDDPTIARRVLFTFQSPTVAGPDGLLRDGSGAPMVDGTSDADAVAIIPTCATSTHKAGIVIFGHGFFGDLGEAQGDYLRRVARDLCVIVVGGTWRGMAAGDLATAFTALGDGNRALPFGERIVQGIVDFIVLEQLARTKLATEMFVDPQSGQSISAPERTTFLGISQGAILGATFFAWDPFLTRAVLHVGGADWSVLFERSTDWVTFKTILNSTYPGPLDQVIMQQVLQMGFDYTDPVHVAPRILDGTKHLILHMSVGDALVSNVATQLEARTMGLPLLGPALYQPYGLTETTGPLQDGFVMFTEEPDPLPPATNLLNHDNNVAHDQLRKRDAVVDQIGHFFETGEVIHTCTGLCNCAQGACGALDPP